MKVSDCWDVKHLVQKLEDVDKQAGHVQTGVIDFTIQGSYKGDYLPEDDFTAFRQIALRHVSREAFNIIAKLATYGIMVEDENGKQITLIDQIVAFYERKYPDAPAVKPKGT